MNIIRFLGHFCTYFIPDIDECSRGICPHDCVNTNGSYECMCYPGYRLEGRAHCEGMVQMCVGKYICSYVKKSVVP